MKLKPTRADLLAPDDELPEGATPFERACYYGARRHTEHWLQANQAAIDVASHMGMDYCSTEMKTLLSRVVLRVLDVVKDGKTGRM